MATTSSIDLETRLRELEQQVASLRARVAELERRLAPNPEHPVDRTMVRERTVYDWQGPR